MPLCSLGVARAPPPPPTTPLSALNSAFESTDYLPPHIGAEWIWGSRPEEPLTPTVLLNRCHLLGLMVCRKRRNQIHPTIPPLLRHPIDSPTSTIVITETPPDKMTLRQLRDTIDNICVELPKHIDSLAENLTDLVTLVDSCFSRFGALLVEGGTPDVLNDPICVEDVGQGDPLIMKINRQCIRRTLGCFLLLYRHMHLAAIAHPVPPAPYDCGIRKHHMEASSDDFDLLSMRMRIPVASVLNYKQDFSGFFNHISQVVYFHFPTYERSRRVPLEDIPNAAPVQVLPAVMQLYPDIPIHYEEDAFDVTKPSGRWTWIVLPGRIYLASPDARVYHSTNLTALVGCYMQSLDQP